MPRIKFHEIIRPVNADQAPQEERDVSDCHVIGMVRLVKLGNCVTSLNQWLGINYPYDL